MNDLHFDPYQFANRSAFPVSAETSIAFSDYRTMHTELHKAKPAAWVPPFALNDKQLQQALLLRVFRYVHNGEIMPQYVDREKLNRAATAKALKGNNVAASAPAIQREMVRKHRSAVRKAGGFLQLHAAIAFRAWRLGMNSVEVAESLSMTPQAARQALWRLRDVAKELGFDVGRTGYTAGKQRKPPKPPKPPAKRNIDTMLAEQLREKGMTIKAAARELGVSPWGLNLALRREAERKCRA